MTTKTRPPRTDDFRERAMWETKVGSSADSGTTEINLLKARMTTAENNITALQNQINYLHVEAIMSGSHNGTSNLPAFEPSPLD